MNELDALASLAKALGVYTHYIDGLGRPVTVAPETLLQVCAALGADVAGPADAAEALRAHQASESARVVPPALVAWDGELAPLTISADRHVDAEMLLEDGGAIPLEFSGGRLRTPPRPARARRPGS